MERDGKCVCQWNLRQQNRGWRECFLKHLELNISMKIDEASNHIPFPKSLFDCRVYTSHLLHICPVPRPKRDALQKSRRARTCAFAASVTSSRPETSAANPSGFSIQPRFALRRRSSAASPQHTAKPAKATNFSLPTSAFSRHTSTFGSSAAASGTGGPAQQSQPTATATTQFVSQTSGPSSAAAAPASSNARRRGGEPWRTLRRPRASRSDGAAPPPPPGARSPRRREPPGGPRVCSTPWAPWSLPCLTVAHLDLLGPFSWPPWLQGFQAAGWPWWLCADSQRVLNRKHMCRSMFLKSSVKHPNSTVKHRLQSARHKKRFETHDSRCLRLSAKIKYYQTITAVCILCCWTKKDIWKLLEPTWLQQHPQLVPSRAEHAFCHKTFPPPPVEPPIWKTTSTINCMHHFCWPFIPRIKFGAPVWQLFDLVALRLN